MEIGQAVEVLFVRATDEEIAKRPGVYQLEAERGIIEGAHADGFFDVRVFVRGGNPEGRRRLIAEADLKPL